MNYETFLRFLKQRRTFNLNNNLCLVADLGIRGAQIPQAETLFDVQVTDTNAAVGQFVSAVLSSAEEKKKRKYLSAAELHHASLLLLLYLLKGT